jgi:hypothetical protein
MKVWCQMGLVSDEFGIWKVDIKWDQNQMDSLSLSLYSHPWANLKFEYVGEFKNICKNALECETGAQGMMIEEKKHEVKI